MSSLYERASRTSAESEGKNENEIIRVQTIWSGRVFNDDIVSFHKTRVPRVAGNVVRHGRGEVPYSDTGRRTHPGAAQQNV